jgi:hypothetical protein
MRLGRPQGRSGHKRKISSPPGFDPRTVHSVASRYTDYAIPAPIWDNNKQNLSIHTSNVLGVGYGWVTPWFPVRCSPRPKKQLNIVHALQKTECALYKLRSWGQRNSWTSCTHYKKQSVPSIRYKAEAKETVEHRAHITKNRVCPLSGTKLRLKKQLIIQHIKKQSTTTSSVDIRAACHKTGRWPIAIYLCGCQVTLPPQPLFQFQVATKKNTETRLRGTSNLAIYCRVERGSLFMSRTYNVVLCLKLHLLWRLL